MNDVDDKLIEGLEEQRKRIATLEARIEKYADFKVKQSQKLTQKDEQLKNCDTLIGELNKKIEEKDLIIHAIKTDQVSYKVDIVNNWYDDSCWKDTSGKYPQKMIQISEVMFAFIKDGVGDHIKLNRISLWSRAEANDWCEVSDLTELRIWEYQEIKSYAIAVGMIKEEEDLFI